MSYRNWIDYIQSAEKSSMICNKVRKIHYKFPDGPEMIEEYSMDTGRAIKRLWKKKPSSLDLSGSNILEWNIELGDVGRSLSGDGNFLVKESVTEVNICLFVYSALLCVNFKVTCFHGALYYLLSATMSFKVNKNPNS